MQIGHLDGIRDGEIYGWAFDTDRPDDALVVDVYIDGQRVSSALAGSYRVDLANHFNDSGRHAFYIDLAGVWTPGEEPAIEVRLPNGNLLNGAPIQAPIPHPRLRKPTLIFIHIAKTAGTSLREAIARNYRNSEIIYMYPQEPGFPIGHVSALPREQLASARFLMGHFIWYGVHEWIPNECLYFTVARDPVARVWSNYLHLVQSQDPRVLGDVKPGTLEEMLESKSRPDLDNSMVRYISGRMDAPVGEINADVYELAVKNMRDAFPFVGLQEELREAYAWLQRRFNWEHPPSIPWINVKETAAVLDCGDGDRRLIEHSNRWDVRLYEEIRRGTFTR